MFEQTTQYFKENGYVMLAGALPQEKCEELTQHMFSLYEQGKLVKDDQCPLSDSVYGDPIFDKILADFAEPIGQHIGKKLVPTYTYCRIYRKGEVLKRHSDRPSCEISATMTLGFDPKSSVWPIYFTPDPTDLQGKRIEIPVGDLVVYRGNELVHWRPQLKSEWQVQVFFHYVDADGPYAEEYRYDQREALGMPAESKQQKPQTQTEQPTQRTRYGRFPIFDSVMIPSWDLDVPWVYSYNSTNEPELMFTPDECQRIIDLSNSMYPDNAAIGIGKDAQVNKSVRDVQLYNIGLNPDTRWIFDKLSRAVSIANNEHFRFEIMGITHGLQLLHYQSTESKGHYDWHMDVGGEDSASRKISVSIQLSDPRTYTGGVLEINDHGRPMVSSKEQGSITMFPSYLMHRVQPMQSGERWALVIWVHGSHRFR